MPKQKTNSSAKKRFLVTGAGKIMRKQVGVRHNLRKKNSKSKRALAGKALVSLADHRKVYQMLIH